MSDPPPVEETAAAMQRELESVIRRHLTFAVALDPLDLLPLAALVQLAVAHPHVSALSRGAGENFLRCVRDFFHDCPTVLQVLNAGCLEPGRPHQVTH